MNIKQAAKSFDFDKFLIELQELKFPKQIDIEIEKKKQEVEGITNIDKNAYYLKEDYLKSLILLEGLFSGLASPDKWPEETYNKIKSFCEVLVEKGLIEPTILDKFED